MWYMMIVLAALLCIFVSLYLRTQRELNRKKEELKNVERQKIHLEKQTESLSASLNQKAATFYLYGQLIEEAAQSARMKEYSRTIVRESENMIAQISKNRGASDM